MKTSAVASALLLALASTSTVAATVYSNDGTELKIGGRAEFRGDFNADDEGEKIEGTMGDASRARINVGGTSQISEGLSAFGFYEAEAKPGASLNNRYLYAGVKTDFGAFAAGRQDMAAVMISDMTDITTFSGVQQNITASKDKQNSVLAYRGSFDALQLDVTYAARSDEDADLFSVAGMYSLPMGLDLGLGYSSEEDANAFIGGVAYSLNNLYVAGTFSFGEVSEDVDFTTIELSAEYKLTSALALQANYSNSEEDADGEKTDVVDHFELGAVYKLNSNFRTYAAARFAQIDDEANGVRIGARYDF
ncbi:porin [Vibrio sp. WXL210]|uniref:porin n=1 Tax=Vibrio sp. WXL210 TaxID=3450709 RepID=UPI003EC6C135